MAEIKLTALRAASFRAVISSLMCVDPRNGGALLFSANDVADRILDRPEGWIFVAGLLTGPESDWEDMERGMTEAPVGEAIVVEEPVVQEPELPESVGMGAPVSASSVNTNIEADRFGGVPPAVAQPELGDEPQRIAPLSEGGVE